MLRRLQCYISIAVLLTTVRVYAASTAGYIDTPDECCIVQRIDAAKGEVYLASAGNCQGHPGRTFVPLTGTVTVFRDGRLWEKKQVQELTVADLGGSLKEAKKLADSLKVQTNAHQKEMQVEAEKTFAFYQSPEFQQKVQLESDRLKREVFNIDVDPSKPATSEEGRAAINKGLKDDERIYLFISSSMPQQTVRNYVVSAVRFHDPQKIVLVMRGFIGGMSKMTPTMNFIADCLKVDPACDLGADRQCSMHNVNILIDPLLFRKFGIEKVPAVVFAQGVKNSNPGGSDGAAETQIQTFHVVYGDASLEGIVEKIRRETGSKSLANILAMGR